ncbi:hypothetical protein DAPPUDRAFT_257954 [Daphnia pulex]|uniref:Uncharacterized protein n=1 Tax=Daphnia pulex TaxID=6669 RepID=E9HEI5_DAPPU|nr:hypothetical protein DAPPUDRAFT_257954 [Daphnia pulex]|eukprot:EFX69872.1 hypothetical protein DAPPUDRAFT_257954 [Daphnia pulex]
MKKYCEKVFVAEEGMRGLVRGWVPTAIGYSAQFGSHETFKTVHANALREEDAYVYGYRLYLSTSAPADIVLSPIKVENSDKLRLDYLS